MSHVLRAGFRGKAQCDGRAGCPSFARGRHHPNPDISS